MKIEVHLTSNAVNNRRTVVGINFLHEIDKSIEFARTDLKIIVVDKELGFCWQVFTCILERLDGIILDVIAPVEPISAPIEVQAVGCRLHRRAVVSSVSIIIGIATAECSGINASDLIASVGNRLIYNIIAIGHNTFLLPDGRRIPLSMHPWHREVLSAFPPATSGCTLS